MRYKELLERRSRMQAFMDDESFEGDKRDVSHQTKLADVSKFDLDHSKHHQSN